MSEIKFEKCALCGVEPIIQARTVYHACLECPYCGRHTDDIGYFSEDEHGKWFVHQSDALSIHSEWKINNARIRKALKFHGWERRAGE